MSNACHGVCFKVFAIICKLISTFLTLFPRIYTINNTSNTNNNERDNNYNNLTQQNNELRTLKALCSAKLFVTSAKFNKIETKSNSL